MLKSLETLAALCNIHYLLVGCVSTQNTGVYLDQLHTYIGQLLGLLLAVHPVYLM